ncbi:hypothetical protein AC579_9359 [Pseudocercospora musae]|uniref:DUF7918 domain-containing protein n=1 Tax=Pseudocercospora musae TaxID=113226 RepID=A0A139I2K6_9PEZI|nr:hypothetical protein AC579_9359 [Pseudocercospora musae]
MRTIMTEDVAVELTSAGHLLQEYDDEDSAMGSTVSAYVEVVEGSNFVVRVTVRPNIAPSPKDELQVRVKLDGKYVTGMVYSLQSNRGEQTTWYLEGRDRNTSRGVVMERFQFAHLQTNDGPLGKEKVEAFKHLGEVKIGLAFVRRSGEAYVVQDDSRFVSAFASNVPEKCLKGKAISSHATLGPQELRMARPVRTVPVYYPYGRAFASYIFKYRSKRDLQIEGIIPRSPSPTPLEDRDPDDLTPEEARELIRRMRDREKHQAFIKKEIKREKRDRSDTVNLDDESDDDGVLVTGEGAAPARKRARASTDSGVECIDLTGD